MNLQAPKCLRNPCSCMPSRRCLANNSWIAYLRPTAQKGFLSRYSPSALQDPLFARREDGWTAQIHDRPLRLATKMQAWGQSHARVRLKISHIAIPSILPFYSLEGFSSSFAHRAISKLSYFFHHYLYCHSNIHARCPLSFHTMTLASLVSLHDSKNRKAVDGSF